MRLNLKAALLFSVLLCAASLAFAQGAEPAEHIEGAAISVPTGVLLLKIVAAELFVMTLIVIIGRNRIEKSAALKKRLFLSIVIPLVIATVYFGSAIIYENLVSETGGPIHWHADFHVYACGEKLDLKDPQFPSNKIGTPLYHEHNDDRIHLEGTLLTWDSATFGRFFDVIGGDLEPGYLKYPTVNGVEEYRNGDICPDGSVGTLKVYVNGQKIDDYSNYIIYPHAYVPPGDCIMVMFDSSASDTTDVLCESWQVKGWTYDNFERPQESVGDRSWQ